MTQTAKHTPGPWIIRDGSFIDAPTMTCLANVRAAHVADNFECQANAKLIAAAPDLLEALRSMCEFWAYGLAKPEGEKLTDADHNEVERLAEIAGAAIAKAVGS